MAEIMFLNIISAIKNPGPEIELTAESLKNIELNSDNLRLRWIIVDGSKTAQTLSTISKWQDTVSEFNYIQGEDKGIYDAINKGLSQIRNGSFYDYSFRGLCFVGNIGITTLEFTTSDLRKGILARP